MIPGALNTNFVLTDDLTHENRATRGEHSMMEDASVSVAFSLANLPDPRMWQATASQPSTGSLSLRLMG